MTASDHTLKLFRNLLHQWGIHTFNKCYQKSGIKPRQVHHALKAGVVRRIFTDYANGTSPKKIAAALNAAGVAGPSGKGWGASTLHGNRERGTGILNNELYIGRQVWNRLTYAKNPDTGKRVSRFNPKRDWVITAVPELRIIDQSLWESVRTRQGVLKTQNTDTPIWDRRRPRSLFSELLKCGCCGGGFSKVSQTQFGCSTARNKGSEACANMATISHAELERLVLDAMQNNLLGQDALDIFCAESTKDRMQTLDDRRIVLNAQLSPTPGTDPIRIHPRMAMIYREKVAVLIKQLSEPDGMPEAKEALRALVNRIVLQPSPMTGKLDIHIEGALAGLLSLSLGSKRKRGLTGENQAFDSISEVVLVPEGAPAQTYLL